MSFWNYPVFWNIRFSGSGFSYPVYPIRFVRKRIFAFPVSGFFSYPIQPCMFFIFIFQFFIFIFRDLEIEILKNLVLISGIFLVWFFLVWYQVWYQESGQKKKNVLYVVPERRIWFLLLFKTKFWPTEVRGAKFFSKIRTATSKSILF